MKKGKRKSILAKLLSCVMVLQVAASFGASSYAAESESGTSVTPIFNPGLCSTDRPVRHQLYGANIKRDARLFRCQRKIRRSGLAVHRQHPDDAGEPHQRIYV